MVENSNNNNKTKPHYQINDTKNPNLLKERQSATFDVEQLTYFLFGESDDCFHIDVRRKLIRLALSHPIHKQHLPLEYLDDDEYYSLILKKSLLAVQETNRLNIENAKDRQYFYEIFVNKNFAFYVHLSMCLHTLETLATEQQKEKFLSLAKNFDIILTYAQTELGHGTDIRRLETEAVFDLKTDSFILNTPTLTATKFWPGALGKTANYVLLMAQLYTPDRSHPRGLQMFLVQIRDLKTHQPLEGIEIGEISTRYAHALGDNGYLRLTNVHIPRTQMLMKLTQVDEKGNFHRLSDDRRLYGSMIHMRIHISSNMSAGLAHAITIAIRYSAVRLQGQKPDGNETQILDYPLQQEKLIPCLAIIYAFLFSARKLEMYNNQLQTNENVFMEQLPELHAISSGLKAYVTLMGEEIVQICRASCGGHGFLIGSGLVLIRNMFDAGCSAEGDNAVLFQQTARYLIKAMQQSQDSNGENIGESVAYFNLPPWSSRTISNPDDYCRLFECRSYLLIQEMHARMFQSSSTPFETWLNNSIELVHLAKAYMETFMLRSFYDQLIKANRYPSISLIFEQLFYVFAIHTLRKQSKDFIRFKLLSAEQIYELETNILFDMYTRLRPNLVSLVDAFDFHDDELDSCLGRYDGQVYEALMERARLNPTNRHKVHPVWQKIKQGTLSKI